MSHATHIGIAALLLATGTAHSFEFYSCGKEFIYVYDRHGPQFYRAKAIYEMQLPQGFFRFDANGNLYYRGHKCLRS